MNVSQDKRSVSTQEPLGQEVTLTNCDREPIRIPGHIQPHGILLVLEPATSADGLKILQVSANVESQLAVSPHDLLGQPLSKLVGSVQAEAVSRALSQVIEQAEATSLRRQSSQDLGKDRVKGQASSQVPLELTLTTATSADASNSDEPHTADWYGHLHASDEAVIFELTPRPTRGSGEERSLIAPYDLLRQSIGQFQQAQSIEDVASIVVQAVQSITGMDRVMVYRLGTDYSGAVIAEANGPNDLIDSPFVREKFLGLRFPATDIPVQARQLYLQSWIRVIPHVSYTPVPLVPERHPHYQRPLDLSAAELRSVSSMHVEYLQNMKVAASMSISLITEDGLWGLIACHHSQPKYIDYETRKVCELVGQLTSVELFRQQTLIERRYQSQVRAIQQQIRLTISNLKPAHAIESVLLEYQEDLLTLVQASGAVIVLGSQLTLIGETPSVSRIRPILDWLVEQEQDVYYTHTLSLTFEPAYEDRAQAAGLLAISIFLPEASYHILWFRPEQKQAVQWAGNPNKSVATDANGRPYLTPRQSFERWQETVDEQSLPWEPTEIAAAQELRSTLLLTALEFSRAALRETAKKAQVANQAKSQFLAKMSHELRTPLNAILGFTQLIHYHETLSSEQRDRLDIINRSGEHLLSLINDVLETSRIEVGQPRLNESCFDLYQLITSVRSMLTLRAVKKGLLLKLEQAEDLPQYVWGDEGKLRQIILNLVGNAVKFTAQGRVTLSVWATETTPSSNRVCVQFEVTDTGPGIIADNFEVIFEPFHQTETGRKASEGSGLGLSISRQNARLMGGDIEVRSQLGEGSTFTGYVQLDVVSVADLVPSSPYRKVVALAVGQPQYRILVVEDVLENRQLLISLLMTVGFEVRAVKNGTEAVAVWREWQPHCIWMDLYMPETNGYDATRQIRAAQSADASRNAPVIIAISASVIEHMRDEIAAAGFDDYVCKPFQVNEIFEKMRQHLKVEYEYAASLDRDLEMEGIAAGSELWNEAKISDTQVQLQRQPRAWRQAFYRAVLGAREQKMEMLIEQLPDEQQVLAGLLSSCVSQLRFDVLSQLVQPLIEE